jgi:hypothetical protein
MQTDTNLLLLCWKGNLDCEPLSWLTRALWSGGSGFAAQGSGRALAPVHLAAPSLCPEKSGPGLCFLPRNFPGWPRNPAYQLPAAPRARGILNRESHTTSCQYCVVLCDVCCAVISGMSAGCVCVCVCVYLYCFKKGVGVCLGGCSLLRISFPLPAAAPAPWMWMASSTGTSTRRPTSSLRTPNPKSNPRAPCPPPSATSSFRDAAT